MFLVSFFFQAQMSLVSFTCTAMSANTEKKGLVFACIFAQQSAVKFLYWPAICRKMPGAMQAAKMDCSNMPWIQEGACSLNHAIASPVSLLFSLICQNSGKGCPRSILPLPQITQEKRHSQVLHVSNATLTSAVHGPPFWELLNRTFLEDEIHKLSGVLQKVTGNVFLLSILQIQKCFPAISKSK